MPDIQKPDATAVAEIVRDAGGKIVGRTKLQKIAYFLELAGLGRDFRFEYRHYGPYSEDLASAARAAKVLGQLEENELSASWGGTYSVYTTRERSALAAGSPRDQLVSLGVKADSIELELAATAAFLAAEGHSDPWDETARRKPEKASDTRLKGAQSLYRALMKIDTPSPLPPIVPL